jgi:hypothetical protein
MESDSHHGATKSSLIYHTLNILQKQKELGLPNSDFDYKMDKRDQYLKQMIKNMK